MLRLRRRNNRRGALLVAAVLVMLLGGCGDSERDVQKSVGSPAKVRPVSWAIGSVMGPRTITIAVEVGYCAGFPKPRLANVKVGYTGQKAYIRAEVAFPRNGPAKGEICGGVGYAVSEQVHLEQPLESLQIYDTSQQPPVRRWPRSDREK
jgi:hypothetical protein